MCFTYYLPDLLHRLLKYLTNSIVNLAMERIFVNTGQYDLF
jgi:hypothetical protein